MNTQWTLVLLSTRSTSMAKEPKMAFQGFFKKQIAIIKKIYSPLHQRRDVEYCRVHRIIITYQGWEVVGVVKSLRILSLFLSCSLKITSRTAWSRIWCKYSKLLFITTRRRWSKLEQTCWVKLQNKQGSWPMWRHRWGGKHSSGQQLTPVHSLFSFPQSQSWRHEGLWNVPPKQNAN